MFLLFCEFIGRKSFSCRFHNMKFITLTNLKLLGLKVASVGVLHTSLHFHLYCPLNLANENASKLFQIFVRAMASHMDWHISVVYLTCITSCLMKTGKKEKKNVDKMICIKAFSFFFHFKVFNVLFIPTGRLYRGESNWSPSVRKDNETLLELDSAQYGALWVKVTH